jgi:glycosyltransferase involved in cell wall biosynthesis
MTDRPAGRSVAVLTPWYPNRQSPFAGAFVQAMVAATAPGLDAITVYHLDQWRVKVSATQDQKTAEDYRGLLQRARYRSTTVAGAGLVYVPVPTARVSYATAARRFRDTLSIVLGGQPLSEPVVHAHVGLPGGWTALESAQPGARVFVTEHATYLPLLLAQPDSRDMYDEVISRATGFFAVGDPVRQPLVEAFPHHADKIQLIPNPIPFNAPRQTPVRELKRWLYMGNLIERKRVGLLLEAFAKCHTDDDSLTLSIVGEGVLRKQLMARAVDLGVQDAVTFVDPLPPEAALAALREHDLLVHLSRLETFGMTIVEAVAMGTPVLVTRCGGPEESLAGIETLAGEFVDVDDSPQTVVEGFRRLQKRFPDTLDLPRARAVLEARYGYPAVGQAHHRAWFDDAETAG